MDYVCLAKVACIALSVLLVVFVLAESAFYYLKSEVPFTQKNKLSLLCYRLLSWLFSSSGLLALLICAIVFCVVFSIVKETSIGDNNISALTICVAISALIPAMISRIIAKNEINKLVDERFEKEFNKNNLTITQIRKDKAHSNRMSGELLYQAGETATEAAQRIKDYAWAIGWASEAIISYVLIKGQYSNYEKNCNACCSTIINSYNSIVKIQNKKNQIQLSRKNFRSLITMISILQEYDISQFSGDKSEGNNDFEVVQLYTVCEYFYENIRDKDGFKTSECVVTGMSDDFNARIKQRAANIINNSKIKNTKGKLK